MIRYTINDRVMRDLKKRSVLGLVFYMLLSFLVVTEEGYFDRNTCFSIVFLLSLNGICFTRFFHLAIYSKLAKINDKINVYIFMTTVVITALVWGLGFSYFLIQPDEFTAKVMMSVCTAGLCAGGVVAFIPERRLSLVFNILMTFPAIILLLTMDRGNHLAVMIILYSVYLGMLTFRGSREYWDALENEHKLSEKSEELKLQSYTDVLTGIYNRRFFNEIFEFEWKRAQRNQSIMGIVISDIDYFKRVNDSYGHMAGDEYLKRAAVILQETFKRNTDIVARYGGEEFIILLLDTSLVHLVKRAEEVRHRIETLQVYYNEMPIATTMSFGVATCMPNMSDSSESLVAKADRALYNAKKRGRNRVEISR